MIGFYGFNPAQNPIYSNLLGQGTQQNQMYQNPLFSRLGGDNSFSRLQSTYSNVFNPEIIQAGLNAYNQGMAQFTPFNQAKYDADLKAQQEAAALKAAQANQQSINLGGLYRDKQGRVGTAGQLYMLALSGQGGGDVGRFYNDSRAAMIDKDQASIDKVIKSRGFTPLGGK